MTNYDIAVIGGGAAGLASAISAARHNPSLRIAILERMPRIGKKILATGNGRCNYTNRNITKSNYFGSCASLYSSFCNFNCEEFFEALGVCGYSDEESRVYPLNNSASAVLDGLRLEILKYNIDVICDFYVSSIIKKEKFRISSENDYITASSVIIAAGGMSQQNLGSDGSILRLLKKMNIDITPLYPALTSFRTDNEQVRPLKGIRANADAVLLENNKKIGSERGEVQFGDGTISGICVFNLSCLSGGKENMSLKLDFLPDLSYPESEKLIRNIRSVRYHAPLEDLLSGIVNKRIGMTVIKTVTGHSMTEKSSVLSDKELKNIAFALKNLTFKVTGLSGFEKSQVTAGGVKASEINENFESKKYKGMYFCGEILDIIGICGGYNLHFAFASGVIAGKKCAEELNVKS